MLRGDKQLKPDGMRVGMGIRPHLFELRHQLLLFSAQRSVRNAAGGKFERTRVVACEKAEQEQVQHRCEGRREEKRM